MKDLEDVLKEYKEEREKLVELNSNLQGVILRDNEKKAAVKLEKLKEELRLLYKTTGNGTVPYDIPTLSDKALVGSGLYQFIDKMPKGAELHVHDMALLPANELIDLLLSCPEFCINSDKKSYDLKTENPKNESPAGYLRLSEAVSSGFYTKEELIHNWTLNEKAYEGKNVWTYFEELFKRQAVLSEDPSFTVRYYDHAFRYYIRRGIVHVEIRLMLTEDMDSSREYVRTIRKAYYDVKKDYPFFTVRIIGAGVKADTEKIEYTKNCFLNASYVQETVKDESDQDCPKNFLIGFDLVNEEDMGLPLKAFVPMLLQVKRRYPDMKLLIHAGESLDAGNENIIDAYLLGASRVGHGLNLYRYPDLHARYVRAEICLEICPISNERLGYITDLRSHPATEYLKSGIVMALCSDDPAYMEHHALTDDFFAATVSWDLGLAELKQFGINSILYSGLDEEDKRKSLRTYQELWNAFLLNQ